MACGLCYANCFSDDKLQCSLCAKYCHRSCLKISKSCFKYLIEHGVDQVVCDNKCGAKVLPFFTTSDKAFLDTNVGKRKLPCKKCYRECHKVSHCVKCSYCAKWRHHECIDPNWPKLSDTDSFFCSKLCDIKYYIKLQPFSTVENYELEDEMSFFPLPAGVSESVTTPSLSKPPEVLASNVDTNEKTGDVLNDCVDSFSHVYCDYASQNNVSNIMCTGDPNALSIFHGNIDGLNSKLDDMTEVFSGCEKLPDIIAVSETGLNDHIESEQVALNGYNFERNDSPTNKGGVGVYVSDQLDYDVNNDLRMNIENCEDLWFEISGGSSTKHKEYTNTSLTIGVIYRHPNTPFRSFTHHLCRNIQLLNRKNKKFIIVGDINLNILKYNLVKNISDYVNKLKSSGCNIHCNLPTRIKGSTKSCIDHVYSNFDQHNVETSIILSRISDHYSTLTKIVGVNCRSKKVKNVYKRKFRLTDQEKADLVSDLDNLLNNNVVKTLASCPNVMAKIVLQSYQNIMNKYYPLIKVPNRALKFINKPWLTKGLKISIRTKNRLQSKLRKHCTENAENHFKRFRNILTKLKKKSFNLYYAEKCAASKTNISKTWKIINEIIKRKKSRVNTITNLKDTEGNVVNDENKITDLLNYHFSTIGKSMAKKCVNQSEDPLGYINHSVVNSLYMTPTTPVEILEYIDKLDITKAAGSDEISCLLIKLTRFIIAPILSNLFNVCIYTSTFPDVFKIAEVIPLFKGGDKHVLGNYRPISLLPQFGKIFEKVIASRLTDFFNANNIFTSHQYGFRKSYSTELAAVDVHDHLLNKLHEKQFTCAIFLDLAKAFDSVNHNILLNKLRKYGIRGPALSLLQSYLSNRRQYVKLCSRKSNLLTIDIGIPQGSILGPLLFLIYINDLPNASNFFVKLFADDTFLSLSDSNLKNLKVCTNAELKKIYTWLGANKLTLNIAKSKFMIITNKRVSTKNFYLKINRTALERCSSYKYLGLFFDKDLNWNTHVNYLCKKLSKTCGIISKLRHCIDIETLKIVYYSLGYSYLRYGNIVWGNAAESVLEPLKTLQRRIIKIMTFAPFGRVDVEPVFRDLRILGLPEIHFLEKAKFMFKYFKGKLPQTFDSYFVQNEPAPQPYFLRHARQINRVMSRFSEKMMKYNGIDIWNTIPEEIQNCNNIKSFCYRLKKDILFV